MSSMTYYYRSDTFFSEETLCYIQHFIQYIYILLIILYVTTITYYIDFDDIYY